jgi:hypothetical protein
VVDGFLSFQFVHAPDHLLHRAESEFGHDLPQLFGHEEEEIHDMLRLAAELLPQNGILRRHPHRTGVEMAFPHHDAAFDDQRRGREAEFFGAQQRGNGDVAAGLQLPVGFDANSSAQIVQHQRLMRFGQTQFPRDPAVFDRGQGRGAGAA